ncbi:MAG: carbohydrate ABC transporter permease [Candidatus Carbobacillus altaicus]|nr:carbohydrate ABC transporter permease [Candidatus Carbobacillus altaicus]
MTWRIPLRWLSTFLSIAGMLSLSVIFIFPFVWMILTAFKSYHETVVFPPIWIPSSWHPENFVQAWTSGPFLHYLKNSLLVAFGILFFQIPTIVLAAYAFARYKFFGRSFLFALTMVTLMVPGQLIFLPDFLLLSQMGLINTLWSLILPFASSAFGIFLVRQSFKQVPEELIEAARLDEAKEWQIILNIMVPMARPALITFALFSFITHWNDYFWPLVMTTDDAARTLPLGIAKLRQVEGGSAWHIVMAGNVILVLPILFVFLIAQRYIVRAFVYTGIK